MKRRREFIDDERANSFLCWLEQKGCAFTISYEEGDDQQLIVIEWEEK